MNRKVIIIAAVTGAVSFAAAFAAGWLTMPAAASGAPSPPGPTDPPPQPAPPTLTATLGMAPGQVTGARSMTEEQLKALIYDVRERIQQYDRKLQEVEREKERLQIAQQTLQKDIETLNNLRVDLAASVADMKNERETLLKTRVQVAAAERANLMAIAAAYDRMDPAGASQILTSMATGVTKGAGAVAAAANMDDAVKILFFMQDRTKARVLAEMVQQEPALTALLSQKLKQVQEGR